MEIEVWEESLFLLMQLAYFRDPILQCSLVNDFFEEAINKKKSR